MTSYNEEEDKLFKESYGYKAVGGNFNPSGKLAVEVIKTSIAELINDLDQTRSNATDPEVKRMCSVAITELQAGQMWAVKALTWDSNT
jgi:hypothetical protein